MDAPARALKAHRKRLRSRGMKRVEVIVPAKDATLLRQLAVELREDDSASARLRSAVQVAAEADRPASALDVFAMTEPLSAEGERLWNEIMEQIERAQGSGPQPA